MKGIYDTLEGSCRILVTGSARLNVYRKGSDSLPGRYFHFRLHPFSLREMRSASAVSPENLPDRIFSRSQRPRPGDEENLSAIMKFGPFPEPLLGQNERRARLRRRNRSEAIIREDLRDLSRLPELSRIEMMAALLPGKVGSLFSVSSLREDLEVGFDTVKRWLGYLRELYYLFEVKPYSEQVPRSLKKEGKICLWDFSEVENEAARFENLIAFHLLKSCHFWTDTGEGNFELRYLRNKEKQEIDFLILKNGVPWLPVEAKPGDRNPSSTWRKFLHVIPCRRGIQVVRRPAFKVHEFPGSRVLVIGAAELLGHFT